MEKNKVIIALVAAIVIVALAILYSGGKLKTTGFAVTDSDSDLVTPLEMGDGLPVMEDASTIDEISSTEYAMINSESLTLTAPIVIDNTGGDCSQVGTWDSGSKTCTLTQDLIFTSDKGIVIVSDGVTLDGGGHTINNYRIPSRKCVVINANDVIVKNTVFWTCYIGIETDQYNYRECLDIRDNTFRYNGFAIAAWKVRESRFRYNDHYDRWDNFILGGDDNKVLCNTFEYYHGTGVGIPLLYNSKNNEIKYNTFKGHYGYSDGIILYPGSQQNEIKYNDFTNNFAPIFFWNSGYDTIYNNNLIANTNPAYFYGTTYSNTWNLNPPIGGNYWSSYDTPAEGCSDVNSDGFCDAAYNLAIGNTDNYPWTAQIVWECIDDTTGCAQS